MISEHVSNWLGLPVELYKPAKKPNYAGRIYRLATDWDGEETMEDLFAQFTEDSACAATKGIIIGPFHGDDPGMSSEEVVQLLVAARKKLPNLRGIFIGDMLSEENEISWIIQSDVSPIFEAYPALEHFRIRGAEGLAIGGGIRHAALKSLIFESGGLPAAIIREIGASQLPAIEHLEIWTGSESYGGNSTVADLSSFLSGEAWPKLKSLGLRDSEYADAIAEALNGAPVLAKLEELDLSLGVLGDPGGDSLLKNAALSKLKKLDLHHHYMSKAVMAKVQKKFPFADVSDQNEAGEYGPYIAVSE